MLGEIRGVPAVGPRKSYDRPTAAKNFRLVYRFVIILLLCTIGDFFFSVNFLIWEGDSAVFCLLFLALSFPLFLEFVCVHECACLQSLSCMYASAPSLFSVAASLCFLLRVSTWLPNKVCHHAPSLSSSLLPS